MSRLIPKPHMLKSVRARNWSLAGAIEELVDNSLGHGRATSIEILISNTEGIVVADDGCGIDDVNRIFRYGDASAHDDLTQIGQYGVGAKNATIYLGDTVTVLTNHAGLEHVMTVNWAKVERSGEWPEEYKGKGKLTGSVGTTILIQDLARHYQLATSERMAKEFGQVFAPALRTGTRIELMHQLARGEKQILSIEPYTPCDLGHLIAISGKIDTRRGPLRWQGRAGLSPSLPERFNAVHIAFGHRVIEQTRDPFKGKAAPTFYAEVLLDDTTPWKHQLSEHKDKVVRYRDELMDSIFLAIKELLETSERQAQNLALNAMIAPIESALNKAMKGAGILHHDPDEVPNEGGENGDGPGPVNRGHRLYTPTDSGEDAKEAPRPTGVNIEWVASRLMEGRAFGWSFSGKLMTIKLDEDLFKPVIDWPIKLRDKHTIHLVVSFLAHALEMEYWNGTTSLKGIITPGLEQQIEIWATEPSKIAPYLYKAVMSGVTLER